MTRNDSVDRFMCGFIVGVEDLVHFSCSRETDQCVEKIFDQVESGFFFILDHYTNKAEDAKFGSIMLMPHCKNLEIFTVSGEGDVATNNAWDTFQRYFCLDNSQRVIKTSSTQLEETTQGSSPQTSSNGF